MRIAVLGASVVASLVSALLMAALAPNVGFAQRTAPSHVNSGGGVIALATAAGEHQQVTIIDPDTRALSVYHINLVTGGVELKSVRNIHWDLQMTEFNGTSPLPREIRSLLEQK